MNNLDYQRMCEARVIELGEQIGFGNMMTIASQVWGKQLRTKGVGRGGEFTVGPCAAMMVSCDCKIPHKCGWCCGTRLLTKHVKAVKYKLSKRRRK